MINYLYCEHELPIDMDSIDWSELEFQTSSMLRLGGPFDKYTISEDGQIYREQAESIEASPDTEKLDGHCSMEKFFTPKYKGVERIDGYTGEVRFVGMHLTEKEDYWFEFVALFKNGDLLGIVNTELSKESSKKRKKAQENFAKELKSLNNKKAGIWFTLRSFYVSVVDLISEIFIKFILFIRNLIT